MRKVIVYTTEPCRRCGTAKKILDRHGAEYEEINLAKDPVGRAKLAQCTGLLTFPQIVIGDQSIGGLDDLRAADADGRLRGMLRETS